MKTQHLSTSLMTLTFVFFISAILSCNTTSDNRKESNSDSTVITTLTVAKELIPDSTAQFLLISAANDFHNYKQSTPVDFRKVRIGYAALTPNQKTFILCGEFVTKEKKDEWIPFVTLKTSGYEQYMGNQALSFCEKATMVLTNETNLSAELKNKLEELRK